MPISIPHTLHARTLCKQLFQDQHKVVFDAFLKKQEQATSAEPFWMPIINYGDAATDEPEAANIKAAFTSTNKFLTEELEQSHEFKCAAKRQAMLDVWICWIATLHNFALQLAIQDVDSSYRRFVSSDKHGIFSQTSHDDFPIEKNASPGYLFLVNGGEAGKIYFSKGYYSFVSYTPEVLREMLNLPTIEPACNSTHARRLFWSWLSASCWCWVT